LKIMNAAPLTAAAMPSAVFSYQALAVSLDRSLPSLQRDDAAGRIPRGFRIGRSRKWLRAEIDLWLSMGCPPRAEFEARQAARA
jgi:predicted DNA-binding transcriptional regulator AlpA